MTIDLVPGFGVRLSRPWPDLAFGMSKEDVRQLLEPHGGVSSRFVCGAEWAVGFTLPGVGVTLSAGRASGLDCVSVVKLPLLTVEPWPVGFVGIDVFGWSADEVLDALQSEGLAVPELNHGNVCIGDLRLSSGMTHSAASAPRKKLRRQPPYSFGYAALWLPRTGTASDPRILKG
ncbi:hypothetical protein ABIA33_007640 [Streptacidiphilus sp. MAP12-16]|uniref:hypothetical protein n=1 Tax=Streptacidiphilus sp. MAP12-16 TaxID=3156300 RepID=UPI00351135CB